jgi:hypothetical protein
MKATKAQVAARVEQLLRIRLDGAETWDIREYVREKVTAEEPDPVWGDRMITDSQIRRYLQRVDLRIKESCRGSTKRLLRNHLARRRNLYAKAVLAGDFRTALSAARDEAELLNLYPPQRHQLTGKAGGPLRFTLEDAVRADQELEKWQHERPQPGASRELPTGNPEVP